MKTKTKPKTGKNKKTSGRTVKSKAKSITELRDLFVDELKDVYWAEKVLTKAIPKMIKNATSEDLIDALTNHLDETNLQVTRLEDVFDSLGVKAQAKKCEAMDGLIKEATELMEETEKGTVRDAAIISAGQKVEHYEIATYGTLSAFAKTLGEETAVSLLEETLSEEKGADQALSQIALSSINLEASHVEETVGE
jgi:ferritin-like metal-binding protein YciE